MVSATSKECGYVAKQNKAPAKRRPYSGVSKAQLEQTNKRIDRLVKRIRKLEFRLEIILADNPLLVSKIEESQS